MGRMSSAVAEFVAVGESQVVRPAVVVCGEGLLWASRWIRLIRRKAGVLRLTIDDHLLLVRTPDDI